MIPLNTFLGKCFLNAQEIWSRANSNCKYYFNLCWNPQPVFPLDEAFVHEMVEVSTYSDISIKKKYIQEMLL